MANLEGDVMRAVVQIFAVIKDQVMANVQSAAIKGQILGEDTDASTNLKRLDKIVRDSVDQAGYNGMREMTGTIKPYIRLLQQAQLDKAKQ